MIRLPLLLISCSLLCASLSAFDIGLKGVEFGSLTYQSNDAVDTVYPANTQLFSDALTLEEGDILQILQIRYGSTRWYKEDLTNSNNSDNRWVIEPKVFYWKSALQDITLGLTYADTTAAASYIVGPAVVQVGYNLAESEIERYQFKKMDYNHYITVDYAILHASSSSQSTSIPVNTVVIPTDANGDVEIILESSVDLVNWNAATPGQYSAATENRFFRIRAVETGN